MSKCHILNMFWHFLNFWVLMYCLLFFLWTFCFFCWFLRFWYLFDFFLFFKDFWDLFGNLFKFVQRLLLKLTEVTNEHQKWPLNRIIPCQDEEKKGQRQKITFLWRNMKEYRVHIWFLPFWHQFGFCDRFGFFFSKFSKKDHLKKMNFEKFNLLFDLVSLNLTKHNKCSR